MAVDSISFGSLHARCTTPPCGGLSTYVWWAYEQTQRKIPTRKTQPVALFQDDPFLAASASTRPSSIRPRTCVGTTATNGKPFRPFRRLLPPMCTPSVLGYPFVHGGGGNIERGGSANGCAAFPHLPASPTHATTRTPVRPFDRTGADDHVSGLRPHTPNTPTHPTFVNAPLYYVGKG